MIRLFTALEIPATTTGSLQRLQSGLQGARWIDPENFHITLRFIGDVPEDTAGEIDEILSRIQASPFDVELRGLGQFGNNRPRAVWARIMDSAPLLALQAQQETALQQMGLAPESRKYAPHITLARLNSRKTDAAGVMQYIEQHNLFHELPFSATRFVLFSARSGRGGGPYIAERTYPLGTDIQPS